MVVASWSLEMSMILRPNVGTTKDNLDFGLQGWGKWMHVEVFTISLLWSPRTNDRTVSIKLQNFVTRIYFILFFYWGDNWGPERSSNLLKITQLAIKQSLESRSQDSSKTSYTFLISQHGMCGKVHSSMKSIMTRAVKYLIWGVPLILGNRERNKCGRVE